MGSITDRVISIGRGLPVVIRLGSMFVVKGAAFKPLNCPDLYGLTPLILMATAFNGAKIYFTMIGMDYLQGTVAMHLDNGVVITNSRGKRIDILDSQLVQTFKEYKIGKACSAVNYMPLYIRIAITDRDCLENTSLRKMQYRLVNICDWPDMSIKAWARRQLNLPSCYMPGDGDITNKSETINCMLKVKVSMDRAKLGFTDEAIEADTINPQQPVKKNLVLDNYCNVTLHTSSDWL